MSAQMFCAMHQLFHLEREDVGNLLEDIEAFMQPFIKFYFCFLIVFLLVFKGTVFGSKIF